MTEALHPVFDEGETVGPESAVGLRGAPLLRLADIEREMRQLTNRYNAQMANLENEHTLIMETALVFGYVEEEHPFGTYRIEETIRPGRRAIDDAAFRDRFPEHCETVLKAPTLAKAERLLRPDELALVVKQGEAKVSRELKFEPAPLPFEGECDDVD